MRPDSRQLAGYGQIQVDQVPTTLRQHPADFCKQSRTINITPLSFAGWKMLPDISQSGGSEHGVTQGVDGHIAIGMCDKPLIMVDPDAGQDHVITFTESVYVQALPYTK
jgi:hypothetical protein